MNEKIKNCIKNNNNWKEGNKGCLSFLRSWNIYHLASQIINYEIEGDFLEFGTFHGLTAVLLGTILEKYNSKKQLHVYDSFEGLPHPENKDKYEGVKFDFSAGKLQATEQDVLNSFLKFEVPPPIIHKGWFKDTISQTPEKIALAHLDGDFYNSIKDCLEGIFNKVTKGGIIIIDDYGWEYTPGVKKATDEFCKINNIYLEELTIDIVPSDNSGYHNCQAIIRK